MDFCVIDFETSSLVDIKKHGAYNYVHDASTRILCYAYKINNGPVMGVTNFDREKILRVPKEIKNFKGWFVAHNSIFDYMVANQLLPGLKLDLMKWLDTASISARVGLPRNLQDVSTILLDNKDKKLDDGKRLIKLYSCPDKNGNFLKVPEFEKKEWMKYCCQDVEATSKILEKLKKFFSAADLKDFQVHTKINSYGIPIDLKNLKKLKDQYNIFADKEKLKAERLLGRTPHGGLVIASPVELKKTLQNFGLNISDVKEGTLNQILIDKNKIDKKVYTKVKKIIEIRKNINAKAPKKLHKLIDFTNIKQKKTFHDQIFYGAHTGRSQCWNAQFYNFPRDCTDDFNRDIKNLKNFKSAGEFAKMLRGLVAAPAGLKIIISDFANIENRLLLFIAGDKKQVARIATGESPYIIFGEKLFNKTISKKDAVQYAIAKLSVLGLGYGTGPTKFYSTINQHFVDTVSNYRMDYPECQKTVKMWRTSNHYIVKLWYTFEKAFLAALAGRKVGLPQNIIFEKYKKAVVVTLPNGSKRWYPGAFIKDGDIFFRKKGKSIEKLWGGVLTENIIQGISREILYEKMHELVFDHGIEIFLHVYDEVNCLVKTKEAKEKLKLIERVMSEPVDWLPGLPLAVESEITKRWKK